MGAKENYDNAVRKSNQLIDTRMEERRKAAQPRFSGALNRESDSDRMERSLKDQKEAEVFNREIDKQSLVNRGQLDIQNAQNTGAVGVENIRGNTSIANTKYNVDALTNTANLDRSANSFFKLVDANRGFSTEGNFPRYYGGKGGNGNDMFNELAQDGNTPAAAGGGMAATGGMPAILQNAGNTNAATTPAFDIDNTLNQMGRFNDMLNPKPKGGFINGMPEADFMTTWGNKPAKNDGGVNSSRYLSLAEQSPARQALLTPQVQAPAPMVTAPKPIAQVPQRTPVFADNNTDVYPEKTSYNQNKQVGQNIAKAARSAMNTLNPPADLAESKLNRKEAYSPENNFEQPQSKALLKTPEEIDSYSQAYTAVRKRKPKKPTYLSGGYGKYY